ncbi:NCS2 family permease [Hydrogenibacillus schlegelii]|uniref:NCS2 family permease n=1 Tax=Hydrogenibacillus schlegelii TaxID=1484 RepID=UPI000A651E82
MNGLEKRFELRARGTNVPREVLAGVTTFLTMVYIVVVNPIILSQAGVPFQQVFMATILATVIGTLWMGLFANYPIAIAPGMGMNAYFAFAVAGSAGVPYDVAFGAVFVAGVLFLLLSLTRFREALIRAIPDNLKHGITAGIGLFIAFIGLRLSGIVTKHPENLVTLGDLRAPATALALGGPLVTAVLFVLRVPGALFFGMVFTGAVAYGLGMLRFDDGFVSVPSMPEWLVFESPWQAVFDVVQHGLYAVVFSFLLVTLFDTTGTMIAVAEQAGLLKNGTMPRVQHALLADSVATTVGAMLGTSPTSAYIESSTGVAAGGRTGLTAVVVAALFILSAFFAPAVSAVAGLAAITAPALIVVGSLMLQSLRHIRWDRFEEAFPAFLIALTMPLTSSIATGIALGFIAHPLLMLFSGRGRTVHPLLWLFAALFLVQLLFLPHV